MFAVLFLESSSGHSDPVVPILLDNSCGADFSALHAGPELARSRSALGITGAFDFTIRLHNSTSQFNDSILHVNSLSA